MPGHLWRYLSKSLFKDPMPDIFTKRKRSEIMSLIRSRGNYNTELRIIGCFRANHITGWRRNVGLFGRPDFVFHTERVVIFVDGCFWHSCPRHGRVPSSRVEYWKPKLECNKLRDHMVGRSLRKAGWKVIRVWECALSTRRQAATIRRIRKALAQGEIPTRRSKASCKSPDRPLAFT